jgi:hypothetical protein
MGTKRGPKVPLLGLATRRLLQYQHCGAVKHCSLEKYRLFARKESAAPPSVHASFGYRINTVVLTQTLVTRKF